MDDVFISYKREERERAEQLANALKESGIKVWWDSDLLSGDKFREMIPAVIDKCIVVVVLWSVGSVTSPFVLDEASHALKQNKLCPARIDGCEVPFGFREVQTEDLRGWNGDRNHSGFFRLLHAIYARVRAHEPAAPPGESVAAILPEPNDSKRRDSTSRRSVPKLVLPTLGAGALLIALAVLVTTLPGGPSPGLTPEPPEGSTDGGDLKNPAPLDNSAGTIGNGASTSGEDVTPGGVASGASKLSPPSPPVAIKSSVDDPRLTPLIKELKSGALGDLKPIKAKLIEVKPCDLTRLIYFHSLDDKYAEDLTNALTMRLPEIGFRLYVEGKPKDPPDKRGVFQLCVAPNAIVHP